MAVNKYFTLTNSTETLSKRFRVVLPGYKATLEKSQNVNKTLDGGLDVSMGGIYEKHEYSIRVREEEEVDDYEEGYGTLEDLKTFYSYNNPNGSPSNVLILTDHYGNSYDVYFVGEFSQSIMGVMIEGTEAWFIVNAQFLFIGPSQEGS